MISCRSRIRRSLILSTWQFNLNTCRCGTLPKENDLVWFPERVDRRVNIQRIDNGTLGNYRTNLSICRCGGMVDTHAWGACGESCGGSTPPIDNYYTKYKMFVWGRWTHRTKFGQGSSASEQSAKDWLRIIENYEAINRRHV